MIENNPYFWFTGLEIPVQIKYLFEKFKNQEITLSELVEKVKQLEGSVEQVVIDKITEMYETGKLEDIIENYTREYLNNNFQLNVAKSNNLNFNRVVRHFTRFKNLKSSIVDNNVYNPNWMQGSTVFYKNGKLKMLGCFSDNSGVNPNVTEYINTMQLIYYPNVANSNNRIISSIAYTLGHGNGMCYNENDGYFYIPFWTSYRAGATTRTPDYHIARIKLNDNETDFIGYEVKEFTQFRTMDLGYFNGKMYAYDYDHNRVVTFDWSTGSVIEICKITQPFVPQVGVMQYPCAFDVQNNMLFACYVNQLAVYDLENGKLIWVYEIDHTTDYANILNEIEGVKVFKNGDIYLLTTNYLGSKGQAQLTTHSIFKANYIKNNSANQEDEQTSFGALNAGRVIYVDGVYRPNPSGYGIDNAFQYLEEAIEFIERSPYVNSATIYLMYNNLYSISIEGSKSITIVGVDANNPDTSHKVLRSIGGIYCRNSGLLHLDNIRIRQSNPNVNSCLSINNAIVSTINCSANQTGTADWFTDTEYGVNMAAGILHKYKDDNLAAVHNVNGSLYFTGAQVDF